MPFIADGVPGFQGPLAGILAALDWIAPNYPDVRFALSAPADTPFVPSDLFAVWKMHDEIYIFTIYLEFVAWRAEAQNSRVGAFDNDKCNFRKRL